VKNKENPSADRESIPRRVLGVSVVMSIFVLFSQRPQRRGTTRARWRWL